MRIHIPYFSIFLVLILLWPNRISEIFSLLKEAEIVCKHSENNQDKNNVFKSFHLEEKLQNTVQIDPYENVIKKYFKYNYSAKSYILLDDYVVLYPNNESLKNYLGLKRENGKMIRRHILLEFHCCKVLNVCVTQPYFNTQVGKPSLQCNCYTSSTQNGWNNEICCSANIKSDFYGPIFHVPGLISNKEKFN